MNNTNLGQETTAEDVLAGLAYAEELSRVTGLPVKMTAAERRLAPALRDKVENLFPIDILELYYMEKEGTGLGKINL